MRSLMPQIVDGHKQIRRLRKVKEEGYRSGDRGLFRQTRNTLNREVRKARRCYGENLKRHLSANPDPSTVWKALQSITGYKKRAPRPVESPRLANQLNKFYCRFDRSSHTTGPPAAQPTYSPLPTTALSTPLSSLSLAHSLAETAPALQVCEEEVRQMFRRQKTRKAPGPDGVSPSCFKVCAEQLAPTFARIFNRSLELCEVPSCFKSSTIVPVAKKPAITVCLPGKQERTPGSCSWTSARRSTPSLLTSSNRSSSSSRCLPPLVSGSPAS
ncbi:uncharacterized protein ACBT44_004538 isoform 1-T1 [Syngnathus typhle]